MFIVSVHYRGGSNQQLICESEEHARRAWEAISEAMEQKRAIVAIENPGSATALAVAEIASVSYGAAAAQPAVVEPARAAWAN
jgi:hypothetical protein